MNYNNKKNDEFDNTFNNVVVSSSNPPSNYSDAFFNSYGCCLCIFSIFLAYYTCTKSCNPQGIITQCNAFEAIFHLLAACICYPIYILVFFIRWGIGGIKFNCTTS